MDKNSYRIPYQELENPSEIKIGKYHYNYKTVDFMFNYKENSEKLLIVFHATIRETDKLPMFLKHNYEKENHSVLAISDKLLEHNKKNRNTLCMRSAGFMESTEYPLHNIYIEIIAECIKKANCEKNIFIGPCVGSKPALYFGAMFNGYIIIMNGWIYISRELILSYEKNANFEINSRIEYDPEEMILKSKPNFIKIFLNKKDNLVFDMNIKFINFCKKNIPDKYELILFDYIEDKDGHHTFFPEGETFDTVIDKI
jgi:hypothetical protein